MKRNALIIFACLLVPVAVALYARFWQSDGAHGERRTLQTAGAAGAWTSYDADYYLFKTYAPPQKGFRANAREAWRVLRGGIGAALLSPAKSVGPTATITLTTPWADGLERGTARRQDVVADGAGDEIFDMVTQSAIIPGRHVWVAENVPEPRRRMREVMPGWSVPE